MDEQAIISRIKYLMGELRLRQNAFASRIGSDVSNFSKQLNGKLPLSESFLNKIVVNLGVSKSWLVKGEGVPFGKAVAPLSVTVPCMEERESASGSPVYDIDVTAGSSSREMLFCRRSGRGFCQRSGHQRGLQNRASQRRQHVACHQQWRLRGVARSARSFNHFLGTDLRCFARRLPHGEILAPPCRQQHGRFAQRESVVRRHRSGAFGYQRFVFRA